MMDEFDETKYTGEIIKNIKSEKSESIFGDLEKNVKETAFITDDYDEWLKYFVPTLPSEIHLKQTRVAPDFDVTIDIVNWMIVNDKAIIDKFMLAPTALWQGRQYIAKSTKFDLLEDLVEFLRLKDEIVIYHITYQPSVPILADEKFIQFTESSWNLRYGITSKEADESFTAMRKLLDAQK